MGRSRIRNCWRGPLCYCVAAALLGGAASCTSADATNGWQFGDTTETPDIRTDTGPVEGDTTGTTDARPDDADGAGGEDAACHETAPSALRTLHTGIRPSAVGPGDVFAATPDGLLYTVSNDRRDSHTRAVGHADIDSGEREILTAGGRDDTLVEAEGKRGLIVQKYETQRGDDRAAPPWLAATLDTDGSVRTIPDLRKTESPSEFGVRKTSFDGRRAVFAMRGTRSRGAFFDYYDGEETHSLQFDSTEPYSYPTGVALVEEGFVARIADARRTPSTRLVHWTIEKGWNEITGLNNSGRGPRFAAGGRDLFWYENTVVLHRDLESGQTSRLDQLAANGTCTFSNLEAGRALLACAGHSSSPSTVHLVESSGVTKLHSSTDRLIAEAVLDGDRAAWFEYPEARATDGERPAGRLVVTDLASKRRKVVADTRVPPCSPHRVCPALGSAAFRAPTEWVLSFERDVLAWNWAPAPTGSDPEYGAAQRVAWKRLGRECAR